MPLLSEIRSEAIAAGTTRRTPNGIQITPLLHDKERINDVQLDDPVMPLWSPSKFADTSDRMTVAFDLSTQRNAEEVQRFEEAVCAALGLKNFSPSLKRRDEKYVLKAKYRGPEDVLFLDAEGKQTSAPEDWRGWVMKIIVSPRAYHLKNTGIVYDLVAVQLLSEVPKRTITFQ